MPPLHHILRPPPQITPKESKSPPSHPIMLKLRQKQLMVHRVKGLLEINEDPKCNILYILKSKPFSLHTEAKYKMWRRIRFSIPPTANSVAIIINY